MCTKHWICIIVLKLINILTNPLYAQIDTIFWFAAPAITTANNNSFRTPISFNISSYNLDAIVTISQPSGNMITRVVSVLANSTLIVDLSNEIDEIECSGADMALNKGIKISSTVPISVYYENSSIGSPELFVLKGRNSLGFDFWISSQNKLDNSNLFSPSFSSFNIVAINDFTIINITPSTDIIGHLANSTFSITLHKGQCYVGRAIGNLAINHLQGTHITSDNPIAITLCDDILDATKIYGGCADLIGDQTIPDNNIGTEYIAVKGLLNQPFDKLYITATRNNTTIYIDGLFITNLNAGQSYEFGILNENAYIQANFPVYVYQLSGIGCELGAAILPQIKCSGSSNVSFVRSTDLDVYITLVVQKDGLNNFFINGQAANINVNQFTVVQGTRNMWYTAKVKLDSIRFPKASIITVLNTSHFFHLGVLQGSFFNGVSFGYFSDYSGVNATATASNRLPCLGSQFQLFADSIFSAEYTWIGPNGYSSRERNPIIENVNKSHTGKYILEVEGLGCSVSYDTVNIQIIDCVDRLIACYPFNGDTKDYSGNSNDGKMFPGFEAKPTADRFGNINKAYNFKNSFILVPVSPTIVSPDTAITICSWVKLNSINGLAPIVCKSNTSTRQIPPQYRFGITDSSKVLFGYNKNNTFPGTKIFSDSISIPINKWFHLAVTFDGQFVKYYKDGILFSTVIEIGRILPEFIEPLEIGRDSPSPSYYLDGDLDVVKIYSRALTSHEIVELYSDTNGCNDLCPVSIDSICMRICKGQDFRGYSQTGIYRDTFKTINNCDSVVILSLFVQSIDVLQTDTTVCKINSFPLNVIVKDIPNEGDPCCSHLYFGNELQSGILAFYPFCQNARDVSGNAHHGIVKNAFLTTDRFGNSNSAFAFSASLHSYIITNYIETSVSNDFTYSVWVKANNIQTIPPEGVNLFTSNQMDLISDGQCIIHPVHGQNFGNTNQNAGSGLYIGNNGLYLIENSSQFIRTSLVYIAPLFGWHQYTIVYKNKVPNLYIDGKFIKQGFPGTRDIFLSTGYDTNRIVNYSNSGFGSGFNSSGADTAQYFSGKIDEICYWNRILLDSEISQLYSLTAIPLSNQSIVYWSTGDTSTSIFVTNSVSSKYYCTINDGTNHCKDSITITKANQNDILINLEICEGQSYLGYNTSGLFVDTLKYPFGCDTVRMLNLKVNPLIIKDINESVCIGQNYLGYKNSGIYRDTLSSLKGCDTIRNLNLLVTPLINKTEHKSICFGQSYLGYKDTGIYIDTLGSNLECDTLRVLYLTILPTTMNDNYVELCEGEKYKFGNKTYFISGIYYDSLTTVFGCDSIVVTNLLVRPNFKNEIELRLCNGDEYKIGNNIYTKNGRYIDYFKTSLGCDSIISSFIYFETCNDIFIPNIFSPNGDNVNDSFFPQGINIEQYQMKIFDRWGNLIFESTNFLKFWDGKFKGEYSLPGVYVYLIEGTSINGNSFHVSGNVTVIR
ncbi:MAG: gliding motility-associated C-terminal domain-containing protein [Saprospiraceae bacterium]|nr:gliding motility-associated C-terminal domain-containing protein [Saprospiraceae bacterium]MBK9723140.1 gliding motility-associated C-terminal domain-containing protein [Saprospiraceae bacterium]